MRYQEGRLQEFIGTHPHLIEAELYRSEIIPEAPWTGKTRPDFFFPAARLVVELKAELLVPRNLRQLEAYLEKPPQELSNLRGVLVGPRSEYISELEAIIDRQGLHIQLKLWEEDIPLPHMCVFCEECGAASQALSYRFCPYCKRRGRLRNR